MGEAAISPKALEDTILKAFPTIFQNLLGTASNPAVEFYTKFQHATDDHDRDFVKKYDEDLNCTLIFAGLFSAVTSAFIIDVQSKLEPDFEEMNHALLKIVASAALGKIPTGADAMFPQWNGPDGTIVHVQSVLYSSLLASLLAAFTAILGKQWLNRYASVEGGSVIDRGRQRKRKMDGMVTWKFGLVMECLPLMLQVALLLLGYALSNYLFFIDKAVAGVVIGFTTFGLLFYLLVVSAATFSYNCPFQTPLSLTLRLLIRFDDDHKKYLRRSWKWLKNISSQVKRWQRSKLDGLHSLGVFGTPEGNKPGDHIELHMAGSPEHPPPIFNKETDWDVHMLDSDCIAWMSEMSMETDVSMAIAGFIPEIVWHTDTRAVPLERLYDMVLKCFDRSSGRPTLKPGLRDRAYLSAKALVHVGIRHRCTGDTSGNIELNSIKARHQVVGFGHYEGDSDLQSTLGIMDRVFGEFGSMDWQGSTFTVSHHAWIGHLLLYRAWDLCRKGGQVPDYIKEFIPHSLQLKPFPPAPIVADCLFIVGLLLGTGLHPDDLLAIDKSPGVGPQVDRIYERLVATFMNSSPTTGEIDRALEVLELIDPLIGNSAAQNSYELFHVIMQAPLSLAFSEEKKWKASRLAMHGAYKWDEHLPSVGDPQDILTFLDHHLNLTTIFGKTRDGAIKDALHALTHASRFSTIALGYLRPAEPLFVRGICHALQDNQPLHLRRAALSFLPLISDNWFNTPNPIMEPDQMKSLCMDWASAVDGIKRTDDLEQANLAVLLGMIESPHWRPHIIAGKWKLLERFTSIPYNSQPLRRCINNPGLMDAIRSTGDPAATALWLAILWYNYEELLPQAKERLEVVTKEVAESGEMGIETCLSVVGSELERVDRALRRTTQSRTPQSHGDSLASDHNETKLMNLERAMEALTALKRPVGPHLTALSVRASFAPASPPSALAQGFPPRYN